MKRNRRSIPSTYGQLLPRRSAVGVIVLALVAGLSSMPALIPGAGASSTPASGVQASAMRQIQALIADKQARTPAQRKINSQLIYAARESRGQTAAVGVPKLKTNVKTDAAGKTVVDISADVSDSLLAQLRRGGTEIYSAFPQYHTIRANVALSQLESIAALSAVRFIQPKQEAQHGSDQTTLSSRSSAARQLTFADRAAAVRAQITSALPALSANSQGVQPNKVNTSEGDKTHRADKARSELGATGTGVKIGVLSDGVDSLAKAQSTGRSARERDCVARSGSRPYHH